MPHHQLSERHLALLGQYDTPTICNAIELFDVRPRNTGYMDARIRACFPEMPPVVGYAATDLDQVRRLGFPVFARGAISAHGYSRIHSLHVPVRVGGLAVCPGDLLHADLNGVTSIPLDIAAGVADVAAEYVAAEAVVLDFIKTGSKDVNEYAAARREMLHRIEQLGKRVQSNF